MARDDFSASVKQQLANRVNHRILIVERRPADLSLNLKGQSMLALRSTSQQHRQAVLDSTQAFAREPRFRCERDLVMSELREIG
jgi:hypothetical protein